MTHTPSTRFDYDLFVIGAGSGGVRAARMAATFGARVAVAEERFLGGTCVNVGCVPKKLMVYGAAFAEEWQEARGYGWNVEPPTHDWKRLITNKDREIERLNGVYQRLLESKGVKILNGRARLTGPNSVEVTLADKSKVTVTAETLLVATGGKPTRPSFPGSEHVLVSDDMFYLPELPKRALVIGGGYIAVEFAGVLAGYGAKVTQAYRGSLFLRGFDRDVRIHLENEMRKHGIDLRFRREVARVERLANGALATTFDDGSTIEVDAILAAIGRHPNTQDLGLDRAGVALDSSSAIKVDKRLRTSVPSIYAVGDVIDRVKLTPVALAEGMIVAQNLYNRGTNVPDYDNIPSAVFSNPSIGTVGLTEEEARADLGAIDIYRSTFKPMKLTMTGGDSKVLMKLVVHRASQRVVGVHMVGHGAGEIIQGFAVALKCGATKAQFDATIGIHPTAAEELVTMREALPEPDHETMVKHAEPLVGARRIVHHRWEDSDD